MAERPKRCKRCGKPATERRPISRRGNCPACGVRAFKDAQRQNAQGGVLADPVLARRWREGMARAAQAEVDERPGADDAVRAG